MQQRPPARRRPLYYPDGDGDNFGTGEPVRACALPPGHALVDGDCDDTDPSIHPDAEDLCDGVDNDCDGSIDQGQTLATYYLDADGDGFGSETTQSACNPPAGYVAVPGDCNDADSTVFPGHEEVCDGRDNDCDGEVDENVGQTFYADAESRGTVWRSRGAVWQSRGSDTRGLGPVPASSSAEMASSRAVLGIAGVLLGIGEAERRSSSVDL